ncbi:hypothetical protein NGM99_18845 [Mesorhizobium sp. RP14(2022)]|uniref:Uncharacterized protein n=1 Tax=Mesorhizobium liriopis TaxID=2953882 RepID=A0ABT1CBK0_9HYPH|nr:hypothetical protein [Mesorhizobium liriopis]MCO6051848.1 hypothetical protein [Mesorhizobium liriopis]
MSRLLTGLVLVAAAIWSAVVWGSYWILAQLGTAVDWNWWLADLPRETTLIANWLEGFLGTYGHGTTMVVWLLGLGLLGILLAIGRLFARSLGGQKA